MVPMSLDVSSLSTVSYNSGHTLIEHGKAGGCVYVLKSGSVLIREGDQAICTVDKPYSIFGETSVLLSVPASATVEVVELSTFYIIKDLRSYMRESPDFAIHVARILAERVADMNGYFLGIKAELLKARQHSESCLSTKLKELLKRLDRFWGRKII